MSSAPKEQKAFGLGRTRSNLAVEINVNPPKCYGRFPGTPGSKLLSRITAPRSRVCPVDGLLLLIIRSVA